MTQRSSSGHDLVLFHNSETLCFQHPRDAVLMDEGVVAQGNVAELSPAYGIAVRLWRPLGMDPELELARR